jgi:acyl-CoA synthetase (NDP forming)/GNAT superfamily N-acetyltransferase
MHELEISHDDVDTLASDGRIVHIRDLGPADVAAIRMLHDRASDRSIYRRYFTPSRETARRYIDHLVAPDTVGFALGAFTGDQLVGIGSVEPIDGQRAEFALLVLDQEQHGGIGTLLLEHLIAEARGRGVRRFVGEVLAGNAPMLEVMRDLGFAATTRFTGGEAHIEFALDIAADVVVAISDREQSAGLASLRPLLAPRSVAVVGAGERSGTVGHEVLRNLLDAGFTGPVYAVNPKRSAVLGVRCVPSAAELPEPVDLAVIALPAGKVAGAVRDCGARGVRAAVLLGSGFGEAGPEGAALQNEVLDIARTYGMRLLGPNCIGVLNTDPAIKLNATFGPPSGPSGPLAVLAQSGAFGVSLLGAAAEVGLGVSQFASIGNKIDVGGNDLLLAWAQDPRTRVVAAYLESIGDPRRFARIARRVSGSKPILVVKSGRTAVGRQAGLSHTAAAASSEVAIDALFRAAGAIRMRTMRELVDAARVLCDVPLPRGPRVAIVGNSGGPEILAADAASDAGLVVPAFDDATRDVLQKMGVPTQNPLDLGAAVQPGTAEAVLRAVAASAAVDIVLTVFTEIAITDASEMVAAIARVAAETDKPVVAVAVGAPASTRDLAGRPWRLPVFTFPEEAAAALGVAHRYAQQRVVAYRTPSRPEGVDAEAARALVDRALRAGQAWLTPEDAFELLRLYGVPVCPHAVVSDVDAAVAAATRLGYPLAVKVAAAGVHKTETGGVRLGVADDASLRAAVADLLPRGGGRVLLQPMIVGGTELIVGSVHDAQCGPLVMIGAGGVLTDVLGDRAFGLAPLTDLDAQALVDSLRSARLLDGYRGAPVVPRALVQDLLVRVGALVDDIPEIAELDVNPVIARADGLFAVDARIRLAEPPQRPDPLVRQLRGPREVHEPEVATG